MCLGWYKAGLRGIVPPLPAEGYNWAQIPALNRAIYEKYHDRPLVEVLKQYRASYRQMLKTVQGHQTKRTCSRRAVMYGRRRMQLAAYFIGATSSHYDWAQERSAQVLEGVN